MNAETIKNQRIFLVDDHPVVLKGLASIIASTAGMEVVGAARSGEEALTSVRAAAPDIAVIDVSLPGIGGSALIKSLLEALPDVKILVLTMHEETSSVRQFFEAGARGYLAKRCAADNLVHALQSLMLGEIYVDPNIAGKLLLVNKAQANSAAALTDRELSVAQLVAKGFSNKEISRHLDLSIKTIETYRARANAKLDTRSRADLVRLAIDRGWLE
jgi:DNA-binding NarL/FixJ family response regulator